MKRIRTKDRYRVGVVSDTHGELRPELFEVFKGVDMIVHAGDIGKPGILEELRAIAPVVAVRGNMDRGGWAYELRNNEVVEIGEVLLYILHDASRLDIEPSVSGMSVVISGHSHSPGIEEHNSVLYLNPGSAGPKRFRLPVSVALLDIAGKSANAQIVKLR